MAAMLAVLGCCLAPLDLRAPAGIAISTWERTGYRFTASADLPEPLSASPSSSKVHRRRWSTSTMTMATSSSDYSVLGLQPGASRAELKAEYRKRAKSCHPDVNPTLAAAQEFRMLREVIPWLRHHRTLERTLTLSRSDGAGVRAADQRYAFASAAHGRKACTPAASRFPSGERRDGGEGGGGEGGSECCEG